MARKLGFWLKLLAITAFSHIILFFMFFFVFGQKSVFSIDINRSMLNTGVQIKFVQGAGGTNNGAKVGLGKKCNSCKRGKKCYKNKKLKSASVNSKKPKELIKVQKYKSKLITKKELKKTKIEKVTCKSKGKCEKLKKIKNKKQRLLEAKKMRKKKLEEKKLREKQAKELKLEKKRLEEQNAKENKLKENKELEAKKLEEQRLALQKLAEQKTKEQREQEDSDKELAEQKIKEKELKDKQKEDSEKLEKEKELEQEKIEQAKKDEEKLQESVSFAEQESLDKNLQEDNFINNSLSDNITINVNSGNNGELNSGQPQEEQVICIGQQEIETLKLQYEVEKEVAKYWSPPEGLSKDLSCSVNILIDWEGKVKQVSVAKSSGILAYDMPARAAASKLILPKILCGKNINIVFNQYE